MKKRLSRQAYLTGILTNDPVVVSKALTLFESSLKEDALLANQLLKDLYPYAGKSLRIGISGVPGAGKSTFIECLGKLLTSKNKKVAVLTVDPSSSISKGSILGDKTRMESLAIDPSALIRTSPSQNYLGGVAMHTRKLIVLCEAAGYDTIFIETVGTGQSESEVRQMTDFLILLLLSGAGDEIQGMKKGLAELANLIIINKADGDNFEIALHKKQELENILSLSYDSRKYNTTIHTLSSLSPEAFPGLWEIIEQKLALIQVSGSFETERKNQNIQWMNESIKNSLIQSFYEHPGVIASISSMEALVSEGKLSGIGAAEELLKIFKSTN